jgi:predicted methyltransferase
VKKRGRESIILADPPDPVAVCLFDANVDGKLDGLDIPPFVDALVGP